MTALIRNAKQVQQKGRTHEVEPSGPNGYRVVSGTSGNVYRVWIGPGNRAECTCSWGQYRRSGAGSACSHVLAVHEYRQAQAGRKVSAWSDPDAAERQHRTQVDIGDGVILTTRKVTA